MKQTIFEISDDLQELIDQLYELEDSGDEISDQLVAELQVKEEELLKKCQAYVGIIKTNKALVAGIDEEIARLSRKKLALTNKEGWLKEALKLAALRFGKKNPKGNSVLQFDLFKVQTQKNNPVVIRDEELFNHPDYTSYDISLRLSEEHAEQVKQFVVDTLAAVSPNEIDNKVSKYINRVQLKKDLKNDENTIEGAWIDTEDCHVRIY